MDVESSNCQDFVFRENILSSFYITIDCSFILEGCDEISAGAFKHIETPPKLIFLCHCPCQWYDVLMKNTPQSLIEHSTTLRLSGAATAAGRCTGRFAVWQKKNRTSFWDLQKVANWERNSLKFHGNLGW